MQLKTNSTISPHDAKGIGFSFTMTCVLAPKRAGILLSNQGELFFTSVLIFPVIHRKIFVVTYSGITKIHITKFKHFIQTGNNAVPSFPLIIHNKTLCKATILLIIDAHSLTYIFQFCTEEVR